MENNQIDIKNRINKELNKKNKTEQEMLNSTKINEQDYANITTEKKVIKKYIRDIEKIAKYLNVSSYYLVNGDYDSFSNFETMYDRMNKLFINGKTKVDMSKETGIPYNTIKQIFQRRNPNLDSKYLIPFAKYLDVSITYIVFGENDGKGIQYNSDEFRLFYIREIAKMQTKLDTETLNKIYMFTLAHYNNKNNHKINT
jgi:transcriptional regulator with XRE-family HTH domain